MSQKNIDLQLWQFFHNHESEFQIDYSQLFERIRYLNRRNQLLVFSAPYSPPWNEGMQMHLLQLYKDPIGHHLNTYSTPADLSS